MTSTDDSARSVFLAWERWRIPFNVIVICLLVFSSSGLFESRPAPRMSFLFNLLALNIAFCIGPVIEGYFSLFGVVRRDIRAVILIYGFLTASALALVLPWVTTRAYDRFLLLINKD